MCSAEPGTGFGVLGTSLALNPIRAPAARAVGCAGFPTDLDFLWSVALATEVKWLAITTSGPEEAIVTSIAFGLLGCNPVRDGFDEIQHPGQNLKPKAMPSLPKSWSQHWG